MSDGSQEFVEQYTSGLEDYLAGAAEAALGRAYQLGRRALAEKLGVLDVAAAYQEALARVLLRARAAEESAQMVRRASDFLAESLSPFEMTHRGFQETIAKLLEVNETLRGAQRRLSFLAEASKELASSLDYQATLARVARLAVPYLADVCTIDIVEADEAVRRVAVACGQPSKERLARELYRYPPDPALPNPVGQVLRTAQAVLYQQVSDSFLAAAAHDAEHLQLLRQLGFASGMIVPLLARGQALGALSFFLAKSERHYGPADLTLAEDLAGRMASAVDNAWLYREVQEALGLREEFLEAAAHELRTPATSLKGYVQFLQRRGPRDEVERRVLANIAQAAERAVRLARELAEIHELAREPPRLGRSSFDLLQLVLECAAAVEAGLEQHHFLVCAAGPLSVQADRERLALALGALLEHAVKYQPQGGAVHVTVAEAEGKAMVEVRDFGVGIPPDRLAHLFEPLFEPWPSGSPYYVGVVGLSLYLARRTIEVHGGRIEAESQVGQGTTIRFCLPLTHPSG
ncbi:MAG: GAF domain-containing sensor histidine kinase [Chloroflexi bacterium]|nr:GAF domain-containing sensor histidine kinase [Chloroflexota bacterium]